MFIKWFSFTFKISGQKRRAQWRFCCRACCSWICSSLWAASQSASVSGLFLLHNFLLTSSQWSTWPYSLVKLTFLSPLRETTKCQTSGVYVFKSGTYGLTSTLCNILAFYALRKNNRVFLVPYLVFLPLVLVTIVIFIVKSILSKGLTPELLFIPMAVGKSENKLTNS